MPVGLLSPFQVKQLKIRNRLVMPPMATRQAGPGGEATPAHAEHYRKRAAAGAGLIIVEHAFVHPSGRAEPVQLGIHDDSMIPGLRAIAEAVKAEGAAVAVQMNHCGSVAKPPDGFPVLGPSAVPHPNGGDPPREMSQDEIAETVRWFAMAARRAVLAGFDAAEIHGAHGYLLGQFLSPLTNQRTDSYGGSAGNRMRFPLEVARAVREAVGPDYPLLYRLGAWDGLKGGLSLEDTEPFAKALVDEGIDIIDVSGGLCGSRPDFLQGVQGYFVPLAGSIRKKSGAPVICTGGVTEAEYADRLVRHERADLVGVGRAQLADADWAHRALAGLRDAT